MNGSLLVVLMQYAEVIPPEELTAVARFAAKVRVDPESGHWLWIGSASNGYGTFSYGGTPKLAHRVAWQWLVSDIPEGLVLDHVCRTTLCVNPAHIEPVSNGENVLRGHGVTGRLRTTVITACPQGHPYTAENTAYQTKGARYCKQCNRDRVRAAKARKRTASS